MTTTTPTRAYTDATTVADKLTRIAGDLEHIAGDYRQAAAAVPDTADLATIAYFTDTDAMTLTEVADAAVRLLGDDPTDLIAFYWQLREAWNDRRAAEQETA